MESTAVEILNYQPEHQQWFEKFNRDWIEKYFWMEPIDVQVLEHPDEHIIKQGGKILMAQYHKEMAGTVALKYVDTGVYEFTKMAVDEKFQGKKIGYALSIAAIELAKKLNARKIILYSNTVLKTAISLYRKIGFKEVLLDGPYKRSDIKMELPLSPDLTITFRKADQNDLDMIRKFSIQTFIHSFGEQNTKEDMDTYLSEAFSEKQISLELDEEGASTILSYIGSDLVGYARIRNNQEVQNEDAIELQRIYVAPDQIGNGIGKTILDYCIQYAKRFNKKTIWLGVWEKNLKAIRFYERHGFVKFSQHTFLLGNDPQTDLLMKKDI